MLAAPRFRVLTEPALLLVPVKPLPKDEVLVRIQTQLVKAIPERALSEKNAALKAETARRQQLTHECDQLADRLLQFAQRSRHAELCH